MEEKPKAKTGPASFEEMYGEEYTALRFRLPTRQLKYLKRVALEKRVSIADYLRQMIERDMVKLDPATLTALKQERKLGGEDDGVEVPY